MAIDANQQPTPADAVDKKRVPTDYKRDLKPVWCTGCGDFGVLQSIYRALASWRSRPRTWASSPASAAPRACRAT